MTKPDVDVETTVLVVDDDDDLADTYALWLESSGYDVRTAKGGDVALERLRPEIDVILLDRRMPKVPGDVVLREARERKGSYSVSMLTAVEPDESVADLPYDEYIVKPVTKSEVVDVTERLTLRNDIEDDLKEMFRLAMKQSTLEARDDTTMPEVEEQVQSKIQAKQQSFEKKLNALDGATDVFSLISDDQ